jgi:CBS domain-containing protein
MRTLRRARRGAGEAAIAATRERAGDRWRSLTMFSPLEDLARKPLTLPLETSIREALEALERTRSRLVVVIDPAGRYPLGVFTLQDVVRRVALPGVDLAEPIAAVMTSGLISLPPHATAHHAALTMARSGVRHVVVIDAEGRLAGVVSRDELFGMERAGTAEVADALQRADDLEALRSAAADLRRLADGYLCRGVAVENLTHYVSTLNDLLTVRVIELTAEEHPPPPVPWCWIALGSEGRLEQTFATDQDNGLVFEAEEADAERLRAGFLPFAQAVNRGLDACGFPRCRGDVMAGNRRWCLTLEAWQEAFARWMEVPEPEAVLNATIFFDLRPIHGDARLVERLRSRLLAEARRQPRFLHLLAAEAIEIQPPLGRLRDFVVPRTGPDAHTLDLKLATRPYVDVARLLCLTHGVPHTSTAERLRGVAEAAGLEPRWLASLVDAFHFLHLIRLRCQRGLIGPRSRANRVDPRELTRLDRHVLKEALCQARDLQGRVAMDYRLHG